MPGRLLARSASTLCRVQALQAARDAPRSLAAPTRMHPGKRAPRARDRQNPRAGFDMMPREKKGPRKAKNSASAGNRARATPMATMRSTIWPLMLSQSADRHVDRALWPARASERQARSRNALRGRPTATAARSLCSMADAATRAGAILRSTMRCPAARGGTVAAPSMDSFHVSEGAQTPSAPGIEK